MSAHLDSKIRVPSFVGLFNPLTKRLLRTGVPLGPNALLTVTGRKSGVPRTTPVALVEVGGKRWIIGTFGEVNWVRNLRVAGEATIQVGKKSERINAVELTTTQASGFFADILSPYVRSLRVGSLLLSALGAGEILEDPDGAARRRPVFELQPTVDFGPRRSMPR